MIIITSDSGDMVEVNPTAILYNAVPQVSSAEPTERGPGWRIQVLNDPGGKGEKFVKNLYRTFGSANVDYETLGDSRVIEIRTHTAVMEILIGRIVLRGDAKWLTGE
jgi:hypothetical protein